MKDGITNDEGTLRVERVGAARRGEIKVAVTHKTDFESRVMPNDFKGFLPQDPGQNCPEQYPGAVDAESAVPDPLGEPLSIREVARLIGCSPWSIRHRYLAAGLPHFRTGHVGKLVFFRNQVVNWLLDEQRKGGPVL